MRQDRNKISRSLAAHFRRMWASHDIRIRHQRLKRLQRPVVGALELTYQPLALPSQKPPNAD
ncbi:hypothetical protein [Micromonospora sp. NPDC005299]|uniref:MmyB family transcriptional regulator n=1 Tax=Micromonospora sp. NPDC005299 TaxID=3364231 RepID=UPI003686C3E1